MYELYLKIGRSELLAAIDPQLSSAVSVANT